MGDARLRCMQRMLLNKRSAGTPPADHLRELAEQSRRVVELEELNEQLKSNVKDLDEELLKLQMTSIQGDPAPVDDGRLAAAVAERDAAVQEREAAKAGVAELEQKVTKMMAKLNTINQDLQEAQMATMEAAMEKDAVSAERDAVRSECEEVKAERDAAMREAQYVQKRATALEEAVRKAKGIIEALQGEKVRGGLCTHSEGHCHAMPLSRLSRAKRFL